MLGLRPSPRGERTESVYEELLYLSGKTQLLEDLLTSFPERLCAALQLSSFHLFLRDGNDYVLRRQSPLPAQRISFPAGSATVLRMKRDRRPAVLIADGAKAPKDGWQMLATPWEIEMLAKVDAQVLTPLEGRTGLMGFATVSRADRRAFRKGELQFLRDLGPQMGRGLETAQLIEALSEQAAERVRVTRELELAREVQEGLLPRELPTISGIDLAAAYRSAAQIGGDYYDVLSTQAGVCLVVADISGKGISAALLMSGLRAFLHTLVLQPGISLTTLVERLNRLLYKGSSANRYATLFLSMFDPVSRRLTYVNAGHNPPLLLRADGRVEQLTCGGTVVGLLPEVTFTCETLQLETGDLLVAYTDGVTEATNGNLEEWGEERLREVLLVSPNNGQQSSHALMRTVLDGLNGFTDGSPQNDDITLVLLRVADAP